VPLLDFNGDGEVNSDDLEPVVAAMEATESGAAIVSLLRNSHGGRLDPVELVQVYSNLVLLGYEMTPTDSHVDLSGLPASIQAELLRRLDTDHDGFLTPADLAPLVDSLVEQLNSAIPPPSVPSPPRPPPGASDAAAGLAREEGGSGGMDGGAVFGILLLIAVLVGGAFLGGRAFLRRRRFGGAQPTMRTHRTEFAGAGMPSMTETSSYTAPLPALIMEQASTTTSSTKNGDALARARASNAGGVNMNAAAPMSAGAAGGEQQQVPSSFSTV
jgi:hypothetical protein